MFHAEPFLEHLKKERRLSPHTLTAYRNDLEQFITYCEDIHSLTSVTGVRHLHIRAWVVSQMEAGQQPRTINRRLSCLKTWFKYLQKRQILDKDPMQKVIGPRTGKRLPVVVREPELNLLFEKIQFPAGYKGLFHRTILEILYATGIRRSELTQLTQQDIDFGRSVIRIRGKGSKMRLTPMAAYLAELLHQFIKSRNEEFPGTENQQLLLTPRGIPVRPEGVYTIVKRYLSMVSNEEQLSPHVLRHSFATHLSDHGADLNAIRELLGHSNLAATQIYMHNSIEKLKKVYDQAHPKGDEE